VERTAQPPKWIAAAIEPTLRESEVRRAQAKATTDLTSYDLRSRHSIPGTAAYIFLGSS